MVVDDSKTTRTSVAAMLEAESYRVVSAKDGFSALALAREHLPDIVLLDIMLPRLDGYQVCAILKSKPETASIPVVLMSSRDGVFDRARGDFAGCQMYVTKPFTRDSLLQTIKALVHESDPRH